MNENLQAHFKLSRRLSCYKDQSGYLTTSVTKTESSHKSWQKMFQIRQSDGRRDKKPKPDEKSYQDNIRKQNTSLSIIIYLQVYSMQSLLHEH